MCRVYILTSKDTFSAGEAFAYDAQALKRGTVIGEATGGGANPTGAVDLTHGFGAGIPFARAERTPVTRTNWEGRGVQPDVRVPATDALAVALERAGQKPFATIEAALPRCASSHRAQCRLPEQKSLFRAIIEGYASGKPDYAAMGAGAGRDDPAPTACAAGAVRSRWGALQSMKSAGHCRAAMNMSFISQRVIG